MSTPQVIEIPAQKSLDAITAFFIDHGPGQGSVTINCYGSSWTHYWNAMGNEKVREFFLSCDLGYLSNKLCMGSPYTSRGRKQLSYLGRIIEAVKDAIRNEVTA